MKPSFDLDKIKFATDRPTFEKAVDLYESGKVTRFEDGIGFFSAVVRGTHPYRVSVEARRFGFGDCECYLGQSDVLCKHMVALALHAVLGGKKLSAEEKERGAGPVCSGKRGELDKEDLARTKKAVTSALSYVKPYDGPSRTWFAYQDSLDEGCARLAKVVSGLPVSRQTSAVLVNMLLRLDRKLCTGGVDDSNGTVGGFMQEVVTVLEEYARLDQECVKTFEKLCGIESCFGFEEPLVKIFDEGLG